MNGRRARQIRKLTKEVQRKAQEKFIEEHKPELVVKMLARKFMEGKLKNEGTLTQG
jgi:hypothetical protein